jgi:methylglutamate dehydrogenase subunit A
MSKDNHMRVPDRSKYVIVGAGVHGLSTAYHLALELQARGKGSGADILVIDKKGVAAGASGIACGVIRNNYFQPAMRALMAHSVEAVVPLNTGQFRFDRLEPEWFGDIS